MQSLRVLAVLAVAFVLVGVVQADDAKKAQKKTKLQGVVEKVDAEAKTVTIKTGKKKDTTTPAESVTVAFSDATKFVFRTQDGEKEAKLVDLVPGKRVTIVKETKDGKEIASQVMIVEKKKDGE